MEVPDLCNTGFAMIFKFLLLLYQLNFAANSYIITYQDPSGFKSGVPVQTPVFPINFIVK
jgi:hypothetical protein